MGLGGGASGGPLRGPMFSRDTTLRMGAELHRLTITCRRGEGEPLHRALRVEAGSHIAEDLILTWSPNDETIYVVTENIELVLSVTRRMAPGATVDVAEG